MKKILVTIFVIMSVCAALKVMAQQGSVMDSYTQRPVVREFEFRTMVGKIVHVNSWTEDGVKCSVISADHRSDSYPAQISCVKIK
jgi:hypothetical protein